MEKQEHKNEKVWINKKMNGCAKDYSSSLIKL